MWVALGKSRYGNMSVAFAIVVESILTLFVCFKSTIHRTGLLDPCLRQRTSFQVPNDRVLCFPHAATPYLVTFRFVFKAEETGAPIRRAIQLKRSTRVSHQANERTQNVSTAPDAAKMVRIDDREVPSNDHQACLAFPHSSSCSRYILLLIDGVKPLLIAWSMSRALA